MSCYGQQQRRHWQQMIIQAWLQLISYFSRLMNVSRLQCTFPRRQVGRTNGPRVKTAWRLYAVRIQRNHAVSWTRQQCRALSLYLALVPISRALICQSDKRENDDEREGGGVGGRWPNRWALTVLHIVWCVTSCDWRVRKQQWLLLTHDLECLSGTSTVRLFSGNSC
jgi:hypothetical protein